MKETGPATQVLESLSLGEPSNSNPTTTPQLLSAEQRFEIVKSIGEEYIQEDELLNLLTKKPEPICYDGFEPSGRMHIAQAEVNVKIKKAYCLPKIVEGNPCLEYIKYLILAWFKEFTVERNADNGGNKTFKSYEELISDYESGELHLADLKPALSKSLNKILEPVREHFKKDSNAKELLKRVKSYRVTK